MRSKTTTYPCHPMAFGGNTPNLLFFFCVKFLKFAYSSLHNLWKHDHSEMLPRRLRSFLELEEALKQKVSPCTCVHFCAYMLCMCQGAPMDSPALVVMVIWLYRDYVYFSHHGTQAGAYIPASLANVFQACITPKPHQEVL